MIDAAHARWHAYLRLLADVLGLRDWRFDLDRDPTSAGLLAHVEVCDGSRWAVVTFGPSWCALGADRQRQAIVHELIHCHLTEIAETVRRTETIIGGQALELMVGQVRHEIEHAVDAIAEAISPVLPLPPTEGADAR